MSFGSTIHNTLYKFLTLGITTELPRQIELFTTTKEQPILDLSKLMELYNTSWIQSGYSTTQESWEKKQHGAELLTIWFESQFQSMSSTPWKLESGFKVPIDAWEIRGRFDRIDIFPDGTLHIIDYKSGRSSEKNIREYTLQMILYKYASEIVFDKKVSRSTLYFLEDNIQVPIEISLAEEQDIMGKIKDACAAIAHLHWEATPARNMCSYCDYANFCPNKITSLE